MKCKIDQQPIEHKMLYAHKIARFTNTIYKYVGLSIPFILSLLVIISQLIILHQHNNIKINAVVLSCCSLPFLILWLIVVLEDISSWYVIYVTDIITKSKSQSSTLCKSICALNAYYICTVLWICCCIITNVIILVR